MKKLISLTIALILCLTLFCNCGLIEQLKYRAEFGEMDDFFEDVGLTDRLTRVKFFELASNYSIDGVNINCEDISISNARDAVIYSVSGDNYAVTVENYEYSEYDSNFYILYFEKMPDGLELPYGIEFGDDMDSVLAAFDLPPLEQYYFESTADTIIVDKSREWGITYQNCRNEEGEITTECMISVGRSIINDDDVWEGKNLRFHFDKRELKLMAVSIETHDRYDTE